MSEDAPPGPAWAPAGPRIGRPRFDPALYDPTFVPPAPAAISHGADGVTPVAPDQESVEAPTTGNPRATASLVLGICAILLPLLAVPGVILGVDSLRRIKRLPSLPGRGCAIAGIVTSLILGTAGAVVIILLVRQSG